MTKNNVLLIEPNYPNKYPPLGLMKLASYHKDRGDSVRFVKGEDTSVFFQAWDRVYVTTLFSFEWQRTCKAIDFAIQAAGSQAERVFVGGIAASLMHEEFIKEPQWAGVRFIPGLLDSPPAQSLQLSIEDGDFGADDILGTAIERRVPDYDILDDIDYTYPVHDAYFGYASRGCIRKCHFCGVPKLEGAQKEMPPLYELVNGIAKRHGEKKDLILMDNNATASVRYKELIAEICDLGFEAGASLKRDGKKFKRRLDFNQGVDARILAKSPMYLKEMAKTCISPLRIAFDHWGVRKVYEIAVRIAADNGITSLSNYMLYNFMDAPEDLYQRMKLNIDLNEELGVHIWSFPMRYQPVTLKDRSHIGKKWNGYYLRSFQIMLQATKGVVSGNPQFFNHAFGKNEEAFKRLLTYPHGFIFHRVHYESGDGKNVREEYEMLRKKMSQNQQNELINHLIHSPAKSGMTKVQYFTELAGSRNVDPLVRKIISFHVLGTENDKTINTQKILTLAHKFNPDPVLPSAEEFVEDAGLYDGKEVAIQSNDNLQNKDILAKSI